MKLKMLIIIIGGKKQMSENIYTEALKLWGEELQIMMMIEEMSELTKELIKDKRGKGDYKKIREEMADVEIMLTQLKLIFGNIEFDKRRKLGRLAQLIVKSKEKN